MDGSVTTNKGLALIGKLLAQKGALEITRVSVGDGTPPASPETLSGLVHQLRNANIESVTNPGNGEAKIVVTVSSIGVTEGFFIREIGVFAKDPDTKGEVLYSYAGFSNNPQWIRPQSESVTNVATYDLNTIIDRITNVEVKIDPSSLATKAQLQSLDERIAALERQERVKIYGVRWPKGGSASAGERIYDSVGMKAGVGVGAEPAENDFDKAFPFAGRRRCNGYYDAERNFHVTAYEGEPGYTTNNKDKLVFTETPLFYLFDGIDGDYEVKAVSTYPVPGFIPSPAHVNPDGSLRQYDYSGSYFVAMEGSEEKKPSSRSGVYSDYNSLNGWVTDIKKLGEQYFGHTIAKQYIDTLLMMVEFATKDLQTVMRGCVSLPYSADHKALMAEESANRIVITKAQAAGYVVGQAISISATAVHLDDVAKNRKIVSIEDKSDTETYLNFDGAAVEIKENYIVSSRPWVNGATDTVVASSGSPGDNTSGKYPCVYRGNENPYGNAWVNVVDLLASREGASSDNYKYYMNYLPDPSKYSTGTVTSDYIKLDYEMPGQDGYVKEFNVDKRFPFIRMAKTLGASDSTYYADYYYYARQATGAVFVGGDLYNGRVAGPCYFYCNAAPSHSLWDRRARLS